MITVEEAWQKILEQIEARPAATLPLDAGLFGLVLAEDIVSDLEMPPYDKSLMDGYAVRCADLASGVADLEVIEEVPAGRIPSRRLEAGHATRIMTGAPIPAGCDAVVIVERSRMIDDRLVHLEDVPKPGQHILRRGRELREGTRVLHAGKVLRPQEFGVLAAVGKSLVPVIPPPSVAILPTGDELVPVGEKPGAGQIRNSNSSMLLAQVVQTVRNAHGVQVMDIARDEMASLHELVKRGLQADVLILTGGVSAGKLDLVPKVLAREGVEILVHKVLMKPGKPLLFGVKKKEAGKTLVFGLPGNPVGAFIAFELFVGPALRRLAGHRKPGPHWRQALLGEDFRYDTNRPTYHPVRVGVEGATLCFRPVPWFGSPDLGGVTQANGFTLFPPGDLLHRSGQLYPICVQGEAIS